MSSSNNNKDKDASLNANSVASWFLEHKVVLACGVQIAAAIVAFTFAQTSLRNVGIFPQLWFK